MKIQLNKDDRLPMWLRDNYALTKSLDDIGSNTDPIVHLSPRLNNHTTYPQNQYDYFWGNYPWPSDPICGETLKTVSHTPVRTRHGYPMSGQRLTVDICHSCLREAINEWTSHEDMEG